MKHGIAVLSIAVLVLQGLCWAAELPSQKEVWDQADLEAVGPTDNCILMADIVIGSPIDPIGSEAAPFAGTFDGNNHKIIGLRIIDGKGAVGLFGAVSGTVKDLILLDPVVISDGSYIGAIAGLLLPGGAIQRCGVKGGVIVGTAAASEVGGLVGRNAGGVIEQSFAGCNVVGYTVGGLVGRLTSGQAGQSLYRGRVLNCLSTSSVASRKGIAGGLVGDSSESVAYSYADCQDINGPTGHQGALVGICQPSALFMGCFFATDLGLPASSNQIVVPGVTGLPRVQLTSDEPFLQAGWDAVVWGFPIGRSPRLRCAAVKPIASVKFADAGIVLDADKVGEVTLDASDSHDPDGDQLVYTWSWSNRTEVTTDPTLTIPIAELQHGQNVIGLTVTDGLADSDLVTVTVWLDRPPVAKIQANNRWLDPTKDSWIYLDASASTDPDNDELSYTWSWSGWQVTTGTKDWIRINESQLAHGENIIMLQVDDGVLKSEPLGITVIKNTPPVAKIDVDTTIIILPGQDLELQASKTFDPDGDSLIYSWSVNGVVVATNRNNSTVTIPAAVLTQRTNLLALTVHDGMPGYVPSIDMVNVRVNVPPTAKAGPDQLVYSPVDSNLALVLNGLATDPDGDILACRWLQEGNVIATGLSPTVFLPVGLHTLSLEVSDGFSSASDTVDVNIVGPLPVRNIKVSPSTIGRASQCRDVKFYLIVPKGMGVSSLDLSQPIRLYLSTEDGRSIEIGQLARDNSNQKGRTLIANIGRQRLLGAIGEANGKKLLKVSVRASSGVYVLGTIEVNIVAGAGPSLLDISTERLRYLLELP